jgi:hypothetical protein
MPSCSGFPCTSTHADAAGGFDCDTNPNSEYHRNSNAHT